MSNCLARINQLERQPALVYISEARRVVMEVLMGPIGWPYCGRRNYDLSIAASMLRPKSDGA